MKTLVGPRTQPRLRLVCQLEAADSVNHIAYIGLGSNLPSPAGSPAATLDAATLALGQLGKVAGFSSLYETAPVGYTDQPPFINAAVTLETELAPAPLLEALLAIEKRFGRDRSSGPLKGPRTLDLDLLLFDDLVLSTEHLTVPHPELHRRRFVLAPLAQIAPHAMHPQLVRTMAELLEQLQDEGANRRQAVTRLR